MNKQIQWKINRFIHLWKKNSNPKIFLLIVNKTFTKINQFLTRLINPFSIKTREKQFKIIYSDNEHKKAKFCITLLTSTFYDLDGNNFFQGGAERYIVELNNIIRGMGGSLTVFQCGCSNWHQNYYGIDVFGLDTGGVNLFELNRDFHLWVEPGDITIYFQMLLSSPKCNHPSICISHGIDWDAHWLQANSTQYKKTIQRVIESINNVDKVISVDTNTINWIRATNSKLAEKCLYVPNFVDTDLFTYKPKNDHELIILYPRRLSEARGFWLLSQNIPSLIQKFPDIQFHFCGKAEFFEEQEINKLCSDYPKNIKWFNVDLNHMVEVYQSADIVVIPTCYSEGTSLSLLEAMACKKPVIATNVGGLTDLILPGFNGLQIEPKVDELYKALCLLIENPNLREELSSNALKTVQIFDKKIWVNKWRQIINSYLS